jgi:integrase
MVYVRKLPSGRYQAAVRHPNGSKIYKTDRLKRVVEAWGQEMETAFRVGNVPSERGKSLTVQAWSQKWTEARNVEPATAAKNATHLRVHVIPKWGTWPIGSVARSDVQLWVKQMQKAGTGANTITAVYHLFAAMLSDAVLEGLIGASPCREIDLPKVVKPAPRWLSRHEYDLIQLALASRSLQAAGGRGGPEVPDPHRLTWQAFVALGCFSGLRPGELAGLDVEHVDFDRHLVRVQQVMTRHGLRGYGKSDAATRSVPFPPEVGDMLWRLVGDRGDGPVFTAPEGGRVSDGLFRRRVWETALSGAGIEYVRPYVMRHTAASWLVQAGVPTFEIVKMLGHSSTRLVDTYLHLAPDQHDRIRVAWGSGESWRRSYGVQDSAVGTV